MRRTLPILSGLFLLVSLAAQAQFTYTNINGTITITKYTGPDGAVTIPATINGVPVISIGDYAFLQGGLTNITIPNSVTNIGTSAFEYCLRLTNVSIGSGVISIGDNAFFDCGLTDVTIGSGVTNIGYQAFDYCANLTGINVDAANLFYSSASGVLFNKSQTTLIEYPACKVGGGYTIPNSVTNIGEGAFAGSVSLTSVTIPANVTYLGGENPGGGGGAFAYCRSVTGVYFKGNAPDAGLGVFLGDNATVYFLPKTTGWDPNFFGLPTALWLPQLQTGDVNFGVRTNQFGFNINWAIGQTVVVEACTNLHNTVWFPVATNTLTSDSSYFSDPQSSNYLVRFYCLRSP